MLNRDTPYKYLIEALEIFKEVGGRTIVEIGSMRQRLNHSIDVFDAPCCNDGHSSIYLAKNCDKFYSVDINLEAVNTTSEELRRHGVINNYVIKKDDGIKFLNEFNENIDLLFLDAWDVGSPLYAENHLLAYKAAKKNLNNKSLILVDDTDVDYVNGKLILLEEGTGGKSKLITPEAIKDGYKVIFSGRQTLFFKR